MIYKEIIGFPNYKISDNGFVINRSGLKMKPFVDKDGYLRVRLSNNGKKKTFAIHRLVCSHFVINNLNKAEVNHKDGNKENNSASNLEWVTRSENTKHAYSTGLKSALGSFNGAAKLTEDLIPTIRLKINEGYKQKEIAKLYGLDQSTISNIKTGKLWAHV